MIKVLIFDLDDTLYYEKEYVYNGFKDVCTYLGMKYSKNIDELYKMSLEILEQYGRGKIFDILCDKNNFSENISDLVNIYRNCHPHLQLYKDAEDIIKYAKDNNIKLGIITDGCSKVQWNKIKALNLQNIIEKIIVTNDYGQQYNKPHERAYKDLIKYFSIKPEECIYIGDNPKKDFIGARKLKMNTVRIIHEKGDHILDIAKEGYEADICIRNLNEIKELINKGK